MFIYLFKYSITVKFKAIPKKIGNSYFVLVPKSYIDNGLVSKTRENTFHIVNPEIKNDNNIIIEKVTKNLITQLTKKAAANGKRNPTTDKQHY